MAYVLAEGGTGQDKRRRRGRGRGGRSGEGRGRGEGKSNATITLGMCPSHLGLQVNQIFSVHGLLIICQCRNHFYPYPYPPALFVQPHDTPSWLQFAVSGGRLEDS